MDGTGEHYRTKSYNLDTIGPKIKVRMYTMGPRSTYDGSQFGSLTYKGGFTIMMSRNTFFVLHFRSDHDKIMMKYPGTYL